MNLSALSYYVSEYFIIYNFKDYLEILFFAIAFFKVSQWLKQDLTKPLLQYFYKYIGLAACAYYFELTTVYYVLLHSAPAIASLFIVYHQKTLQKQFMLSQRTSITPAMAIGHKDWLETFIRTCMIMAHKKISITSIIERKDEISDFIHKSFTLDIPVNQDVLTLLLESPSFDEEKLIWLNKNGNLVSVNASWGHVLQQETLLHQENLAWQAYALQLSQVSDAIIFYHNALTHESTIIIQGKKIEHLSIDHAMKMMKKIIQKSDYDQTLQGVSHESDKRDSKHTTSSH